ncbi:EI24 domain-containing protein [Bdellovibrio sp. BCCA]|uniref:EI24 domain-containing protein n=1 Tax=Bdellovibrio sp. BCCA TaxID=3136281 RepID=UPI0030F26878
MTAILKAFRQAFDSLLRLQMFWLILLPPFLSVFGFFVLFVIFWSAWVTGLGNFLAQMSIFQWLQSLTGLNGFASWTAVIFLILVFIPLAYLGAVLLTSIFVMPIVLSRVAGSDFKHLEKKKGGTTVGSLWNTLWTTIIFIVAFVVTLPLWLIPGCQVVVPLFLTAWLNKKIFVYDVLQDYASPDERKAIEREESGALYGLGLLLGLLSYIPLAIFFVPVLSALSYTYYGLNALQERRSGET